MTVATNPIATAEPLAGARTFECAGCGFRITLLESDRVPSCPRCGSSRFEHTSMFAEQGTRELAPAPVAASPTWLADIREALTGEGPHLVSEGGNALRVIAIPNGFLRIGRSLSASVRFDDPTVSRRHAVIHRDDAGVWVLDGHSLNGTFVNGERIDWRRLDDGDEVELGGFRLHFVARAN